MLQPTSGGAAVTTRVADGVWRLDTPRPAAWTVEITPVLGKHATRPWEAATRGRVFALADETVLRLYGDELFDLSAEGGADVMVLPWSAGEASKNQEAELDIYRWATKAGFRRGDAMLGIGG